MTGLIDMASMRPWKPEVFENYRPSDDRNESGKLSSNSIDSSDQIADIPSWKSEFSVKSKSDDGMRVLKQTSHADNSNTDGKPSFFLGENGTDELDDDAFSMGSDQSETVDNGEKHRGAVVTSHLKHVQSNPFFIKGHGVIHPHGHLLNSAKSSSNGDVTAVGSVDQEYAPVSGYVSKLRQKFASITVQKDDSSIQRPKTPRRFASVENLIDRPKASTEKAPLYVKKPRNTDVLSRSKYDKSTEARSYAKQRKYSDTSHDNVDVSHLHSHSRMRNDLHHEAADIKIGRDDIIIIEQTKPSAEKEKPPQTKLSNDKMMVNKVKPLKDDGEVTEMPKPNIVSSFRSMFEKGSGASTRKILPDSPKVLIPGRNSSSTSRHTSSSTKSPDVSARPSIVRPTASVKPPEIVNKETVTNSAEAVVEEESNIKPSTMKEKARDTPRLLDSPVTRKKTYPEKKSIFDSDTSISTSKKSPVRISSESERKEVKDNKVTTIVQKAQNSENMSKSLLPNDSLQKSVEVGREFFPARKEVFDSSVIATSTKKTSNISSTKEETKPNKNKMSEEVFPERKDIFDSSLNSVSTSNKNTSSALGKTKRAPSVPQASLREPPAKENKEQVVENSLSGKTTKTPLFSDKSETEKTNNANIEDDTAELILRQSHSTTTKKTVDKPEDKEQNSLVNNISNVNGESLRSIPLPELKSRVLPDNTEDLSSLNDELDNTPRRGLPSVIANRLRKGQGETDERKDVKDENIEEEEDDDVIHYNVKPSQLKNGNFLKSGSPSPRQQANEVCSPAMPNDSEKLSTNNLKPTKTNDTSPKTEPVANIEDLIRRKKSSPAPLFDSSSIEVKAKPKPSPQGVPPLDLTCLITAEKDHPYQEGYIPTKIEPCKFKFAGEGVVPNNTPLKKTRSGHQLKIQFDDDNVQTHEYPREEVALEEYLNKNPAEVEEAKREERERDEEPAEGGTSDEEPLTPREKEKESSLKTNTPVGAGSGELSSYKPKHQEEFQFGMSLKEPEKVKEAEVATVTEGDLHLRPADEEDLHDFSTHDTSDMLF